ncbi:hypothetical protein DFH08DRAFT_822025 [Mycena albidolilacea]|uniref:Uncharacterized protein n=1 Tax=Mycena albidolilacea TaxID=1033008 RepID=A0AAD6Z8U7_9AGAR|nr:hypothetical protein DFH08DRAFT_822025 [Mycena albidolilacea]
MIPVLFCSFFPPSSSLFLPTAPVIDTGDTQPPTPAPDRVEHLWDAASAVWQRRGIMPAPPIQIIIVAVWKNPPFTSNPAELLLSRWSYSEGREQCRGGGAHEMWRLAGASRRNTSDADLGVLETHAIFSGGQGADKRAAQLHALERQYGNPMTIYYVYFYIRHVNSHLFSPKPRIQ